MATVGRLGRQKLQLPTSYYEGFLEIRTSKEQTSRRLWTCLCGDALFFFNSNKENNYVEKLELSTFICVTDDSSPNKSLNTAGLLIHTKSDDIRLTAPSLESRELWKGLILSVKDLSVPKSLTLLPGQMHMMREAVEKEIERREALSSSNPPPVPPVATKYTADSSSSLYMSVVSEMPVCFESVSRTEAEILLERYPDKGNLLLRPGRDGTSFAVTTRQDLNGSVFKHYRVSRKTDGGFYIDVEKPIYCPTLQDVVNYLVQKTAGVLQPFKLDEPYEENIVFVQANQENGERSLHLVSPHPPSLTAECKPSPEPEAELEEDIYLNPDDEVEENKEVTPLTKETSPPKLLPRQPRQTAARRPLPHQSSLPADLKDIPEPPRKALKPPKSKPLPALPSEKVSYTDAPIRKLQNLTLTSELQQKLELRRAKES